MADKPQNQSNLDGFAKSSKLNRTPPPITPGDIGKFGIDLNVDNLGKSAKRDRSLDSDNILKDQAAANKRQAPSESLTLLPSHDTSNDISNGVRNLHPSLHVGVPC